MSNSTKTSHVKPAFGMRKGVILKYRLIIIYTKFTTYSTKDKISKSL
jgi:hypothetical protein